MSRRNPTDPVMILAAVLPLGTATRSPMFAAIKVTAALVARLRSLVTLCQQHQVDMIQVRHDDMPIYWDFPPGSAWHGCMEEHTDWLISGSALQVQLTGRAFNLGLGYSDAEVIAQTTMVDLADVIDLQASGRDLDFYAAEDTEALLGEPFELAVIDRIGQLRRELRRRPPAKFPRPQTAGFNAGLSRPGSANRTLS